MGTAGRTCSFCGHEATFMAVPTLHVCGVCALRVADLAEDPSEILWTDQAPPSNRSAEPTDTQEAQGVEMDHAFEEFRRGVAKQIGNEDAESHSELAQAYSEMGLYIDARRAAAVAISSRGRTTTTTEALRLLLTAPLLPAGGLRLLRDRLRRAVH